MLRAALGVRRHHVTDSNLWCENFTMNRYQRGGITTCHAGRSSSLKMQAERYGSDPAYDDWVAGSWAGPALRKTPAVEEVERARKLTAAAEAAAADAAAAAEGTGAAE